MKRKALVTAVLSISLLLGFSACSKKGSGASIIDKTIAAFKDSGFEEINYSELNRDSWSAEGIYFVVDSEDGKERICGSEASNLYVENWTDINQIIIGGTRSGENLDYQSTNFHAIEFPDTETAQVFFDRQVELSENTHNRFGGEYHNTDTVDIVHYVSDRGTSLYIASYIFDNVVIIATVDAHDGADGSALDIANSICEKIEITPIGDV